MGLADGYGVLLGTLAGYRRDDPNDFGRFMHGVLTVATPAGAYTCAVDVDTRNGAIPVQWRIQPLRSAEWAGLFALPDGWHPLTSAAGTGAADYIRDPRLRDLIFVPEYIEERLRFPLPPEQWPGRNLPHQAPLLAATDDVAGVSMSATAAAARRAPVERIAQMTAMPMQLQATSGKLIMVRPPWNAGSSDQALTDLEAVLAAPHRVMVLGEPFRTGRGVHNIHQNQGDPIGGGHDGDNAIWQDGITIALRSDGTAAAFMNKFSTQADATDEAGHPVVRPRPQPGRR